MFFSFHFTCRTLRTRFTASKQVEKHANRNHSSILTNIKRYFFPVCDILTFKRYFHFILHAKRSARVFHRRNKPRNSQIAIIRRFWRKLNDIYPVNDKSTIKRTFHTILHAERSARVFQRRNKPRHTQITIIRRFWRRLSVISFPLVILWRFNAIFTALRVQNVLHASSSVEKIPDTRKSQSFADFEKN